VKLFIASCFRRPRRHRRSSSTATVHMMKHVHVWYKGRIPGAASTRIRSGTPKLSPTLTSRSSAWSLPVRLNGPWGTKSLPTGAACIEKWGPPEGRSRRTAAPRSGSKRGWRSAASVGCRRGWVPRMTEMKDQLRTGQARYNIHAARTFSSLLGRCANGPMITVRAESFSRSSCMRRYGGHSAVRHRAELTRW